MAQSPDGVLWFGTLDGVWTCDGYDWRWHTEPGNPDGNIVSLCCGPDGKMMVAVSDGVVKYNDGTWSRVFPKDSRDDGWEIRKVVASRDGSIWLATSRGAVQIQDSQPTLYTSPDLEIGTDASVTSLANIEVFPDTISQYPRPPARAGARYDLVDIREDLSGQIWMGTDGGEIICTDGTTHRLVA
ncbi:MAG: hypothetical protein KDA99_26245 [Planctomycetales bacterium]|nr:hypothetical protein [Planctomycetales bacterium]